MPVWAYIDIGEGKGSVDICDKSPGFSGIGWTFWSEVEGIDRSECPVAQKQSIPVMSREPGISACNYSRWTAGSDIKHWSNGVRKVFSPFFRGGTPSTFSTGNSVINTGWTIPGGSHIPFHIRIINKHFPIPVQREIAWIAVAHVDHFPIWSIGFKLEHPSAWCFTVTVVPIGIVFQENIILPIRTDSGFFETWSSGKISRNEIKSFSILGNN